MKIEKIILKNFRCFECEIVEFHDRLTILIGKNGAGKSAVLDAATIAAGSLLAELHKAQASINKDDVRIVCHALGSGLDVQPQYPAEIETQACVGGEQVRWARILRSSSGRTAFSGAEHFKKLAHTYTERMQKGDTQLVLPVISYYGTGRIWAQKRAKRKSIWLDKSFRLNGYLDSLEAEANDKLMLGWFQKMTMRDLQTGKPSPEFAAVRHAMEQIFQSLTGSKDVQVRLNLDTQEIEVQYTRIDGSALVISLNQLSDGYKSAISLIADIAYRMAMLNPQLLDRVTEETHGIVLIDEVDLHLHPAWQHRILDDLLRIFPKVQFIVSTHAPAIIHSARTGRLIILNNGVVNSVSKQAYGKDANYVLSEVMTASSRPAEIQAKFNEYHRCMDREAWGEAENVLNELADIIGEDDAELAECRMELKLEQIP